MTSKYFTCKVCHENTRFATMASDRVELERERGELIVVSCKHCHRKQSIHINEVKAEPNKVITGISVAAGAVASVALWNIGFIAVASFILPVIVYTAQQKMAATFNSYRIR